MTVYGLEKQSSNLSRVKDLSPRHSVQTGSEDPFSLLTIVYGGRVTREVKAAGMCII